MEEYESEDYNNPHQTKELDMTEEELKNFSDQLIKNMFLGLPRSTFPSFAADLEYGFDNF